MNKNKVIVFIILVLMIMSGYIFLPFREGSILYEWGQKPMPWGKHTTTLSIVMWIFGMRFLLLLDALLMVLLIYMKRTKLSMLIVVGLIIIMRIVDIFQLFINGDTSGNFIIEISINAIILFFALAAVNVINIRGFNKDIAYSDTSIVTLSIPFSQYISNLFRPKQQLDSIKLAEELVYKDEKLRYIVEHRDKIESPLMAKIIRLVKMIEKAETAMEKEVLMHEFEVTIARYAKQSQDIKDLVEGKKDANDV